MRTSLDNDRRRPGIQRSLLRAARPVRYSHHGGQPYNSARRSPLDNRSYDVWLSRLSRADWLRYLGRGRCAATSKIAPLKRDLCMPRHYGLNPIFIELLRSINTTTKTAKRRPVKCISGIAGSSKEKSKRIWLSRRTSSNQGWIELFLCLIFWHRLFGPLFRFRGAKFENISRHGLTQIIIMEDIRLNTNFQSLFGGGDNNGEENRYDRSIRYSRIR